MTLTASPRRAGTLALWGLAAALIFTGINGAVLAQDQTLVLGARGGSSVQVDLSVLDGDSGGAAPRQRDLLFPGSTFKPGQRIILRRPGIRLKRTRLRKPRRQPARRVTRRPTRQAGAAQLNAPKPATKTHRSRRASAPPPPPSVVMPAAKSRIKAKKKIAAPAKAKPKPKARAKLKPKSRATANLKAPPLAPPPAMKKPKSAPARPRAIIPPIPAAPKALRKPAPAPPKVARRMTAAPPPPPPPVIAAPRAPVIAKPLAKTTKTRPKAKSPRRPRRQVASIPRLGSIASGSKLRILFAPSSARLDSDGQSTLGPVSAALAKNSKLRVELKAYARGNTSTVSQARRLSLSRALAIRSHLIKRGVRATRIDVRALGNKVPDGVPNRVDLLVFTR